MKTLLKILLRIIIVILVISLIVVGVSYFVTPAMVGVDDLEVSGYSLGSAGLADTTFFDIGKTLVSLYFGDHTMDYEYDSTEAEESLEEKFGSNYQHELETLLYSKLSYGESVSADFSGDEIAFASSLAFESATTGIYGTQKEVIAFFQDAGAKFVEMQVTQNGDQITVSAVVEMELDASQVAEINSYNVLDIGDKVYIMFDCEYILEDGALVAVESENSTISLNNMSTVATSIAAGSLLSLAEDEVYDGATYTAEINTAISELIAKTINNLGTVQGVEDGSVIVETYA